MSDTFEAWWATQGARYSTGDHKERARHAYEAGARSAAPVDAGRAQWLDVLERPEPMTLEEVFGNLHNAVQAYDEWLRERGCAPSTPANGKFDAAVHPLLECAVCGALPGERCVSQSSRTFMATPHPERSTTP